MTDWHEHDYIIVSPLGEWPIVQKCVVCQGIREITND